MKRWLLIGLLGLAACSAGGCILVPTPRGPAVYVPRPGIVRVAPHAPPAVVHAHDCR